jgi:thiamine-monophosphate kinase
MASEKLNSEEAIIGAYFAPLSSGFPGAFGLKDDCAAIALAHGQELVVTTDAVIEGVHFFAGEAPAAIAWKALAVNVSDLTAKGATPLAYLLAIAFPNAPERDWLAAFTDGLRQAQSAFGCHLAGGDTDRTPGPLSVTITAFGMVVAGGMVRRATARPGDEVFVSGRIGDATLGLALRRDPALAGRWQLAVSERGLFDAALSRPHPPVALAAALHAHASAAMDISDGLVKDFDRMCRASGCAGRLEAERVPLSDPARRLAASGAVSLADLITGGEDYQVLACVPPKQNGAFVRMAAEAGVAVTRIGQIVEAGESDGAGAHVVDPSGRTMALRGTGWDHFHNKGTT